MEASRFWLSKVGVVVRRGLQSRVFDDDLDPTENGTTLGAGPNHSLVQCDADDRPRLAPDIGPVDIHLIPDQDAAGYETVVWQYSGNYHVAGFRLNARGRCGKPNASPRLQDEWPLRNERPSEVRDAILVRHRELADEQNSALVELPVLVRTMR